MFPPLTSSSHNRVAGWALDNRLPEDERELELAVEVWVEPQHGAIVEDQIPEYLVGKKYFEIPAKVAFPSYYPCQISNLSYLS